MDPEYPFFPYQDPGITNSAAPGAATTSSSASTSRSYRHGATTTKRTKPPTINWARISAAVLESLRDLHYVLSLAGSIEHVSPNSAALLGYAPEQLIGTVMADHVHEDDAPLYRDELREASSTGRPFRFYCRIRSCRRGSSNGLFTAADVADNTISRQEDAAAYHVSANDQGTSTMPSHSVFEVSGRFHEANSPRPVPVGIGLVATPPSDEGMFVLMARPYPLAQSRRLDSFLSLKMENERLTQQLAALKAEKKRGGDNEHDQPDTEQHDTDYPHRYAMAAPSSSSTSMTSTTSSFNRRQSEGFPWFDATPSTITRTSGSASSSAHESVFSSVSTPFGPASSSSTSTNVSTKPGTPVTSAPSTTKATTQPPIIIPSASKSPTNTPTVMEGDVGIPFIVKALTGAAGIKKRAKHVEDYVCAWCSTTASPEWRKGPSGPKSLCNACGLRYAKSRRKASGGDGSGGSGPATGPDAGGASAAAGAGAGGPRVGPVLA